MVAYAKAGRNMRRSGLCRNLQNLLKSGLEFNTPFSLRVGGFIFHRFAHSAGPGQNIHGCGWLVFEESRGPKMSENT